MIKTLLVTPPFTQLNTPYPATAYLKGFLDSKNKNVDQYDIGIELFNKIFSRDFVEQVFSYAKEQKSYEYPIVWQNRNHYIEKVDRVISYLHTHQVTEAYQILSNGFLPVSHRSDINQEELDWGFGDLGILDKAKHMATLFIEELGDFIKANVDPFFSFTKYAEQIAHSASSFDGIEESLNLEESIIETEYFKLLEEKIKDENYNLICFSIPFPGNLFSALRASKYIKENYPSIKISFGGGYCNTELRSLSDKRIFNYIDFMTLDDGEGPLLRIIEYIEGERTFEDLERTYILDDNNNLVYQDKLPNTIFHHKDLPAPSYLGLENKYLSFLDVMNPMHRLWSDGRWNKLTISHGCYWQRCSFCDTSLDYIKNHQTTTADKLVDKIEDIISQTGNYGFHFVDEAPIPKLLKNLALKLIERKVYITWWTNVRFEKTYTPELCDLLAKSGCIAVTGGLEVASNRLLKKMSKGVDILQVAKVGRAFSESNIMVHAYLMYGFPTQTEQETIDSLEVVKQLFENQCIKSAFWHKFTTTIHSPVGKNPGDFGINIIGPTFEGFAQNDLLHEDPNGAEHEKYGEGLNLALNNYLNGVGFDMNLQDWFDFRVKKTKIKANFISNSIHS